MHTLNWLTAVRYPMLIAHLTRLPSGFISAASETGVLIWHLIFQMSVGLMMSIVPLGRLGVAIYRMDPDLVRCLVRGPCHELHACIIQVIHAIGMFACGIAQVYLNGLSLY